MAHTFLMEPGRWTLEGNWLEKEGMPMPIRGATLVRWSQDNWFTMVTKLAFVNGDRDAISYQYKGRLDGGARQYTFVLQHSLLGKVEGEGWVAPDSIMQRYWVLGDKKRRSSFEMLYRIDYDTYHLSSAVVAGHYLTSAMEVRLERQTDN
ncbi:hypothetical protein [Roseofilum casamattae]|uniref:DUF1579 domain-containing protein n=1 Tax=Roseofilum casamattae BLCC-M143 TaxID=3022442 RepID=A0ABT7BWA0_9CYAN|nr:hypothetical protein [Roseofilum casamattae]MDJ1183482.1 hypothetical protein [Roseofilum casamattae BLCC-M143]